MKRFPLRALKRVAVIFLVVGGLSACGSDGQPVIMEVASTLFVGENPSAVTTIVDPIQQDVPGTLEAQIVQEFNDHSELDVLAFNLSANFPGVGQINFVLDPNQASEMSVSKLNRSNQQIGPNVLNLSLIIETPEQNLTLSNLIFQSDNSALLQLTQNIPPLGFFVNGQSFAIQVSDMTILIPSELIVSDFDPQ